MSKFMNMVNPLVAIENAYEQSNFCCEMTLATLEGLEVAQETFDYIDIVSEGVIESIKSFFQKIWDYICQFCDYVKRKIIAAYNWVKSLFIKKKKEADKAKEVLAKANNKKTDNTSNSSKVAGRSSYKSNEEPVKTKSDNTGYLNAGRSSHNSNEEPVKSKSGNTTYLNAGRSSHNSNEDHVKTKSNNTLYLNAGRSSHNSNEEPVKTKSNNTLYLNAGKSQYSSNTDDSTPKNEDINNVETAKKIIEKYNRPIEIHGWIEPQAISNACKDYMKTANKVIDLAKKTMSEADTYEYTDDPLAAELFDEDGNSKIYALYKKHEESLTRTIKRIEPDQIEEVLKVIKDLEKEVDTISALVKGGKTIMEKIANKFSLEKRQTHDFGYYYKRNLGEKDIEDYDYNRGIKRTKYNIKKFLNSYTKFFKNNVLVFTRMISKYITRIIEGISRSSRVRQMTTLKDPEPIDVYA